MPHPGETFGTVRTSEVEMTESGPDYTEYSLDELREAQRTIDRGTFPDRAARLDSLVEERERELADTVAAKPDPAVEEASPERRQGVPTPQISPKPEAEASFVDVVEHTAGGGRTDHEDPPMISDLEDPIAKQWRQSRILRYFFPLIVDRKSAVLATRVGAASAAIVGVATALSASLRGAPGSSGPLAYADAVFMLILAIGILAGSRTAAILGLVVYLGSAVLAWREVGMDAALPIVFLVAGLVAGVRGTFALRTYDAEV